MNLLAVIAADPHNDAISFYRVRSPFKWLERRGHHVRIVTDAEMRESDLRCVDVVVTCRTQPTTVEGVGLWRKLCDEYGAAWVVDLDDDELNVPPTNPAYPRWRQQQPATLESLRLCDLVTATTHALGDVYRPYNANVAVLPNCVDSEDWDFDPKEYRTIPHLTIGVAGGSSHFADWQILEKPWRQIAKEHPDVHFVVIGYLPSYMMAWGLGQRLHFLGWNDLSHYRRNLANIDIGCCPLEDTVFNRGKSNIKLLEYGMADALCVVSPTVYGRSAGRIPEVARASDPSEWAEAIRQFLGLIAARKEYTFLRSNHGWYWLREPQYLYAVEITRRVTDWEAAYCAVARSSAARRTPDSHSTDSTTPAPARPDRAIADRDSAGT